MEINKIKVELYKSKQMAKFSHYVSGNLYYTVELSDGVYQFPISTIEDYQPDEDNDIEELMDMIQLSSDLGTTSFYAEMKGSELNRWIAMAHKKGDFIKIS